MLLFKKKKDITKSELKNELLVESLLYLCKKVDILNEICDQSNIKEAVIRELLKECGNSSKILRDFKRKTYFLDEMSEIIENNTNNILKLTEDIEDNEEDINLMFTQNKKKLTDDIDEIAGGELLEKISDRIKEAETNFIINYKTNKNIIKKTIEEYENKIDESDNISLKHDYNYLIESIINDRKRNVFGYLIENVAKTVYEKEYLKDEYLNEDSLDMNKVNNTVYSIYTVLETFNSLNILRLNKDSLPKLIKSL